MDESCSKWVAFRLISINIFTSSSNMLGTMVDFLIFLICSWSAIERACTSCTACTSVENYSAFSLTWIYITSKLTDYFRYIWVLSHDTTQNTNLTLEFRATTETNIINKDRMNCSQIATSSFPRSPSLKSHQRNTIFTSSP